MTTKQKKDYLTGRILRYADKVGKYNEALDFIKRHRTVEELNEYQADLTYIAYGKRMNTDDNYLTISK